MSGSELAPYDAFLDRCRDILKHTQQVIATNPALAHLVAVDGYELLHSVVSTAWPIDPVEAASIVVSVDPEFWKSRLIREIRVPQGSTVALTVGSWVQDWICHDVERWKEW